MNSPAIAEIMDYASLGEYHISTLTLGTVALGMAYGISNAGRSPDKREGQLVMNAAFQAGITALDTARSYGDAERLIGRVLAGCPPPLPVVVTKFKIDASALNNPDAARAKAMQDVRESLRQLGIGRVPVCLFHMERTMSAAAWQPVLHQVFTDLKREGLIDVAGVSVDHPQALGVLAEDPLLEAFQVPLNIMDLRLLQEGTLDRLHANGTFILPAVSTCRVFFLWNPRS